jgi:hypothetical protein
MQFYEEKSQKTPSFVKSIFQSPKSRLFGVDLNISPINAETFEENSESDSDEEIDPKFMKIYQK